MLYILSKKQKVTAESQQHCALFAHARIRTALHRMDYLTRRMWNAVAYVVTVLPPPNQFAAGSSKSSRQVFGDKTETDRDTEAGTDSQGATG